MAKKGNWNLKNGSDRFTFYEGLASTPDKQHSTYFDGLVANLDQLD